MAFKSLTFHLLVRIRWNQRWIFIWGRLYLHPSWMSSDAGFNFLHWSDSSFSPLPIRDVYQQASVRTGRCKHQPGIQPTEGLSETKVSSNSSSSLEICSLELLFLTSCLWNCDCPGSHLPPEVSDTSFSLLWTLEHSVATLAHITRQWQWAWPSELHSHMTASGSVPLPLVSWKHTLNHSSLYSATCPGLQPGFEA